MGTRLMDSAPPAMITSPCAKAMAWVAMAMVCRPEEQKGLTVAPDTESGRPVFWSMTRPSTMPCSALGESTAHYHVVDVFRLQVFDALNSLLDGGRSHIIGTEIAQSASGSFADGCAHAADDVGFIRWHFS